MFMLLAGGFVLGCLIFLVWYPIKTYIIDGPKTRYMEILDQRRELTLHGSDEEYEAIKEQEKQAEKEFFAWLEKTEQRKANLKKHWFGYTMAIIGIICVILLIMLWLLKTFPWLFV